MERKLRPVSLAYVLFEEGDLIGHLMGYISISHLFVIGGIIGFILLTMNHYAIYTFAVLLTNEAINYSLKIIFNHPRPELSQNINKGFPSSHAQFWCCFIILFAHYLNNHPNITKRSRHLIVVLSTFLIGLVDFSRWYLNDHFVYQIIAGNTIGLLNGLLAVQLFPVALPYIKSATHYLEEVMIKFELFNSPKPMKPK